MDPLQVVESNLEIIVYTNTRPKGVSNGPARNCTGS